MTRVGSQRHRKRNIYVYFSLSLDIMAVPYSGTVKVGLLCNLLFNYNSFLILGDGRRGSLKSNSRPLYQQGKDH